MTTKIGNVILSGAKDLCAHPDRPFAEFTLSGANVLRVTSDPRLLPVLLVKLHYRPGERIDGPLADKLCAYRLSDDVVNIHHSAPTSIMTYRAKILRTPEERAHLDSNEWKE